MAGVGCGDGAPPFDELPLRDALRAEPDAIAALPAPERGRLAARFESARASDESADEVRWAPADPRALVMALDEARAARLADALVVGAVGGGVARPTTAPPGDGRRALPPLESPAEGATATLELGALDGAARAPLVALLEASGARRLARVTGWPAGAIAIDDVVYVNAAWLVALAPAGGDAPDGGAASAPSSASPRPSAPSMALDRQGDAPDAGPAPAEIEVRSSALSGGSGYDGGVQPSPVDTTCASSADSCSSDSSDGSDDSCDSTDDGCSSTDDGSNTSTDDGCSSSADDGADACASGGDPSSGCQVAGRRGGRGRPRGGTTLSWMVAPLAFLLFRRRA
jgi:hypothetical protein